MAEFTGRSSFTFPQALDAEGITRIESALVTHGAKVDAGTLSFTPDPEPPAYTFACTVRGSDQMAANSMAGIVLGRALHDCGYLF
ncbi:hypothetical protein [Streptacidiphilus sp. P02-A3a]|uniref:hypothetical protein n=1 Tax=Streptacidiphilus sp. P02-A3a TaxID=2704468 RepID=UPI0015FA6405|nr:hypothetical protein [Streptacidiphilus sp. P02-A3a]QMU70680.1 hypothetical protein GXP74_23205 [Streptacidiphilus sp. P02-A3a]